MRLQDLVGLHSGGISEIVDATPAHFDLKLGEWEWLRADISIRRVDDTDIADSAGADTLVLAAAGPVAEQHGDMASILEQVGKLPAGARVVVLLQWPTFELPYHQFLDELVGSECQILQLASISSPRHVPSAMVVQRVEALTHLRSYFGDNDTRPGEAEAEVPLRTMLRLADEFALSDFVHRQLRIRVQQAEASEAAQQAAVRGAVEEATRKQRAKLRATRARAKRAERELAELRANTSLRPTRALTRALSRAWKRGPGRGKTPG